MKKIILNLFDGEGGASVGTGGQNGGEAPTSQTGEINSPSSEGNAPTLDDKRKSFDDLIRNEYKDVYTEKTQQMINKRFKESKMEADNLKSQLSEYESLTDILKAKYGKESVQDIISAINDDEAYWEEIADQKGMTVEQYKLFHKLEAENSKLEKEKQEQLRIKEIEDKAKGWIPEIEGIRSVYPNFDFPTELGNPQFARLLDNLTNSGFPNPLRTTFELMHKDEIDSARQKAQEKAVVDNIKARGSRPNENGTSSQSAFTIKGNVSKLSKNDRAEIIKRVARGEKITF